MQLFNAGETSQSSLHRADFTSGARAALASATSCSICATEGIPHKQTLWRSGAVTSSCPLNQTALGILWIILLPHAQALTRFSVRQFIRMDSGRALYSFFIAALCRGRFQQFDLESTQSITSMMYLNNRFTSPREILAWSGQGRNVTTTAYMFDALLGK